MCIAIRRTCLVTMTLAALLMSACGDDSGDPPAPDPNVAGGDSVRVLTFNTALFSPIFQCGNGFDPWDIGATPTPYNPVDTVACHLFNPLGDNIEERAREIAAQVLAGSHDIVAFNEVWDEDDGKDALEHELGPVYPHRMAYVDVVGGGIEEDSALMIFSKFPLEPLADDEFEAGDTRATVSNDRIGYVKFDDCAGVDCMAAKGAALVRARHPSSERIINVVATHLQADDPHQGVRWKQLRQIVGQCDTSIGTTHPNLVTMSANEGPCAWSNRQWLLLLGDMNIAGEGGIGGAIHSTPSATTQPAEWWYKFGAWADNAASTGFALYDAWAETTSEQDRGTTTRSERRLDYVLASRRSNPLASPDVSRDLCVQHVRVPPEFIGLSDHRAVAADINLGWAHCNPRLAQSLTTDDMGGLGQAEGKEARKFHRALKFPGSMQWFRIDKPGTYTFALDPAAVNDGVRLEIFDAANLSRPLGGAHALGPDKILACEYAGEPPREARCEEVEGEKLVIPVAPLYVRVFNPNRSFSGPYWLAVHEYDCSSQEEACELLPHAPVQFNFPPPGEWLGDRDTAWFRVEIREQADSGARQDLGFTATSAAAGWNPPEVDIADTAGISIASLDGKTLHGPNSGHPVLGPDTLWFAGSTANNATVFLRVKRADENDVLSVIAAWRTNLVLLGGSGVGPDPATLTCIDETNPEWGSDEIDLELNVDGGGWKVRGHNTFDCNAKEHFRQWNAELGVVRYLSGTVVRFVELDDTSGDDESPAKAVDSWPGDSNATQGPIRHTITAKWAGGEYNVRFNTSKWRVQ